MGVHSAESCMIGDRMDTDVIAGIESGMTSVLVLSGVSTRDTVAQFPYRPTVILNGVGDIPRLAQNGDVIEDGISAKRNNIPFLRVVMCLWHENHIG